MKNTELTLKIKGMFCPHCEVTVSKALTSLDGVEKASASFQKGEAKVFFDAEKVKESRLHQAILDAGYELEEKGDSVQLISLLIILLSLYVVARRMGWLNIFNVFPVVESGMELGMLFIIGLLTSVHCIAMCGGINLTQATSRANATRSQALPNLLYNLGRVCFYTVIGAVCGAVGQTIGFSGKLRGILPILVGILMIIMTLNMLGVFKKLRVLNIHLPKGLYAKMAGKGRGKSSFVIGLLNGFMPCGPLQSMQIYALGTGSILKGASSMFLFSLGTVPLMFGFGFFAGKLSQKYKKYMLTVSAFVIFFMGLNMIADGMALSGIQLGKGSSKNAFVASQSSEVQSVRTEIDYGSYPAIQVKKDVPVSWNIYVPEGKLNGCNGEILIPEYDIDIHLQVGDNVVEFTPSKTGTVPYSCWMGMIRSTIEVVE